MAAQGYAMDGFFAGFYSFSPCEPGAWQYQVDIGQGFFSVNEDYASFMRDEGVEIVQAWGPWVILRRAGSEGEFQLYTDVESGIAHYTKILRMFKIAAAMELVCLVIESFAWLVGENPVAGVVALLLAAITLAFMNIIFRTKDTIRDLRERQGITAEKRNGMRYSPFLMLGLSCNALVMFLRDRIPTLGWRVLAVCAITLMVIGISRTALSKDR